MIKFPSIEQFRNVIRNVQHKSRWVGKDENGEPVFDRTVPLPTLKFQGTVKLHGTNAAVIYDCGELHYQSRERIITALSDNAGFAFWADNNEEALLAIVGAVYVDSEQPICIYGEWCGGSIQKGVALNQLEKMFVIFKIKVGHTWLDMRQLGHIQSPEHGIYNIQNFETYDLEIDFSNPTLVQNDLIAITEAVEAECPVGKAFGVSGIGEGVVWSCVTEGWNSSDFVFKVKGEKHSVSKVKTLAAVDVEKVKTLQEFVETVVTENRLNQGLQHLKEMSLEIDVKNTGAFLKWLYADVVKEESDVIYASELEPKDVGSALSNAGKTWWFERLNQA